MSYCSNCGSQVDASARFCSTCGTPVAVTPTYTQPVIVEAAPTVRRVSVKHRVLGFVGLGLGAFAIFMAGLGFLYTMIGMIERGVAFGIAIAFSFFTLPVGIVARSLCRKSIKGGNTSRVCSAGAVLGLLSIIITCVMLFFGIINLVSY